MGTSEIISRTADLLWLGGLAATPLAILVGGACRWKGLRPATRHMLWFAVLASFVTPAVGMWIWTPHWFRSDRLIAAADAVLPLASNDPHAGIAHLSGPGPSGSSSEASNSASPTPLATQPKARASVTRAEHEPDTRTLAPAWELRAGTLPIAPRAGLEPLTVAPRVVLQDAPSVPAARVTTGVGGTSPVANLVLTPDNAALEAPAPRESQVDPSAPAFAVSDAIAPANPVAKTPATPHTPQAATQPAAPAASESRPSAAAPAWGWGEVRAWLVRLLGVRDAIAALPRVPGSVWIGGAVLILALSIARTLLARRLMGRATPADADVQQTIRQVAGSLGLSRMPRAVFVDAAISPMIWCGLRPLLVLPAPLWRTLDRDSRRAVLVHELAHVRRGDHLLCWVQAAIGAVYWWHPVVWWTRRRLHDEAEASCDAWVTSLFPSDRRAYASALIVTKSYLSSSGSTGGPWLGAVSSSAKRLARRITMVMTEKAAPKMSLVGACVATLVLTAGTFVLPGLACPPDSDQSSDTATTGASAAAPAAKATTAAKVRDKKQVIYYSTPVAPGAPPAPTAPTAPGEPGVTFFGEAPALESMRGRQPGADASFTAPVAPVPPTPAVPPAPARAPQASWAPKPPVAAQAPMPPQAQGGVLYRAAPAAGPFVTSSPTQPVDLERLKVGRTPRDYTLPAGKLDAFYELMSRDDVPILVELHSDKVVIWGNEDEHAVFAKFVKIVGAGNPAKRGSTLTISTSPVAVGAMSGPAVAPMVVGQLSKESAARQEAMKQYQTALQEIVRNRDAYQVDVEKARAQAEAAREHADQLRELAHDLGGRAAEMAGAEERKELEQVAKKLRSRSDALKTESKSTEERVSRLERQLEEMERRAEALEQKLEEFDDDEIQIEVDPAIIVAPSPTQEITIEVNPELPQPPQAAEPAEMGEVGEPKPEPKPEPVQPAAQAKASAFAAR